jgi:hypothetical protein
VQAELREVIERAKDARVVLGLGPTDGDVAARAAFHALCKKYHPARFARSSPETVRLANEAFLAIKRAYDGLVRREPTPKTPPPVVQRPADRSGPIPRQGTGGQAAIPIPPTSPPKAPAPVPPAPKPAPIARPPTERTPAQPKPEPAAPPPPKTEDERFAAVLDLLRRRVWRDAERVLGELAVAVPAERKYRAYRHYARGRVAQDDGRLDEARAEWERALRLDPELAAARAAMDSLPEPPKPTGGGLLSRLFKR